MLKDPRRAKPSRFMTRLPRERRVETPGRFGMVNVSDDDFGCRLRRSVPFQWYGISNSVNDEADLIIVNDRFPDNGMISIRLYWKACVPFTAISFDDRR